MVRRRARGGRSPLGGGGPPPPPPPPPSGASLLLLLPRRRHQGRARLERDPRGEFHDAPRPRERLLQREDDRARLGDGGDGDARRPVGIEARLDVVREEPERRRRERRKGEVGHGFVFVGGEEDAAVPEGDAGERDEPNLSARATARRVVLGPRRRLAPLARVGARARGDDLTRQAHRGRGAEAAEDVREDVRDAPRKRRRWIVVDPGSRGVVAVVVVVVVSTAMTVRAGRRGSRARGRFRGGIVRGGRRVVAGALVRGRGTPRGRPPRDPRRRRRERHAPARVRARGDEVGPAERTSGSPSDRRPVARGALQFLLAGVEPAPAPSVHPGGVERVPRHRASEPTGTTSDEPRRARPPLEWTMIGTRA